MTSIPKRIENKAKADQARNQKIAKLNASVPPGLTRKDRRAFDKYERHLPEMKRKLKIEQNHFDGKLIKRTRLNTCKKKQA